MTGRTRAYLLCGPSLAGKSTAARLIGERLVCAVVSADAINEERGLPFGAEGLPDSAWAETLRIQLQRLRDHAAAGRSVVIDDTLCFRWLRDRWRAETTAAGAEAVLLVLPLARDGLLARYAELRAAGRRPLLSEARLLHHFDTFEWPAPEEGAVDVGTSDRLEAWLEAEAARLRKAP